MEIPDKLLAFLEEGTRLDVTLHETAFHTYRPSGAVVTDPDVLAQMNMPGHETAVVVGKVREEGKWIS